ncbi:hypothetical protein ABB28_17445 [Stenotrophomonas chelatiphaga]|jgi:hypothetical protein|uniref:Uncharacterized protein n=1 Tax=Stenotrophomonas chelatiphaga TaxID=517011 RepID=A0A0R0C6K2_9GAMM|nr:hypothetical protein [Stenotrophomonas chelatiphaga]KRG64976.1 hypothetical protein ABB28_17445 [Stenotrophomonas chelatiphaga]
MSFRQFPAVDSNGDSRIILEFTPDAASTQGARAQPRYELEDGRVLVRSGREFVTPGGDVRLSI